MSMSIEEWPAWSVDISASATIQINGQSLPSILFMIGKQLDLLKNKCTEQQHALQEAARREENYNEKNLRAMNKMNDRIEKLQKQLDDSESGRMEDKLRKTEERVRALETIIAQNSFADIHKAIADNKATIEDHELKLLGIQSRLDSDEELKFHERILRLESDVDLLNSERDPIHAKISRLEDDTCWYKSQSDKMYADFQKLLQNESTFDAELTVLKDTVNNKHAVEINKLHGNKVDRDEFNDFVQGTSNRGLKGEDFDRIQQLLNELDRRTHMISAECRDGLDNLKAKTEKKIDFLHKWILKHLSNIHAGGGGDANGDYTDIGKVRCLVCNHVMQNVDPDTPFVKPDFKNTFGVLHFRKPLAVDDSGYNPGLRTKYRTRVRDDENYKYKLDQSNSPPRQDRDTSPTGNRDNRANMTSLRPMPKEQEILESKDVDDSFVETTRPQTSAGGPGQHQDNGIKSDFYQEMERRYLQRPKSAPPKKQKQTLNRGETK